ncbi:asparaginase domain-containing protein [bacterium endosymbiont of Bathymodiolus sp. 5 South]|jgi:L-asparaginase|uniref:asparaginase domain-containing protein n=1 Tax=bacterium endosymbiont of Bathymodiolus sp. 5 South TaxID=1181670 RepID=UPI0010B26614|nr:asparaginase domain-containing protein [bacterium endosymbiont of Bathymodiolus sp. 5 South]CAC9636182.1 L-asparaginase (EC 3.5.1.1) [uncultured Gammaproteobacteria bacterium]CAC9660703.1 L-asparaginase (EC 3.5.1.1) [uncultured Gammaproteobacteria bacterium]SSC08387.1 L-asparaginase [bacterium endosymbiont of Bathymodiolus sp. 5 South]VVH55740.1 asparaginase/glutaminase [uncultured Gammaproteobacteria bacterium]VVH62221.1 L-asparaginase (EC [uncultured Gammaproteobacteria bacterium]
MKIKVLMTGGTIDKVYNTSTGELTFVKTHIIDMLNRSRSMVDTLSEVLFLKDSLEITQDNRALILSKCLESEEDFILITHGTDTMVETAQLLGVNIKNKTIVLFGAMLPYSVNQSDGLFNLGFALSSVQNQPPGVYIAMNGQVFDFDKVQKNTSLGIFENI